MSRLFFRHALLPQGWARDVVIDMDDLGWITALTEDATPDQDTEHGGAIAIPGLPNLHSHAFQRAMAGLAEAGSGENDSFWSWRQTMYKFVERLNPDDLAAIARLAYVEMLESGFTGVAEFHYLHDDPNGHAYADVAAMAGAIAEAAEQTGMGLTLLPVFYGNGGFGGVDPDPDQRRFINDPESYGKLLDRAQQIIDPLADAALGLAPHSLRAVTPETLAQVLDLRDRGPVHMHIAEQVKEVDDCLAWSGARPVDWLFDNVAVDSRWCLIHATHMSPAERRRLASSPAVAGLCPITEANLGDGIFDGVAYVAEGGNLGIGSDSNIQINAAAELRLLEYGQRLRDRGRNRLTGRRASTGRTLFDSALAGGAQASGRKIGQLAVGYRGDVIALDQNHPAMVCRTGDDWLDGWIFTADKEVISDVWVGGKQVVAEGRHVARERARQGFEQVLKGILSP